MENPITVLNQDTAKTFLAKSDPEMLYQFFHRSTQLRNCEEDYNAAAEHKNRSQVLLQEKLSSVTELKKVGITLTQCCGSGRLLSGSGSDLEARIQLRIRILNNKKSISCKY